jgi:hypothetical protein
MSGNQKSAAINKIKAQQQQQQHASSKGSNTSASAPTASSVTSTTTASTSVHHRSGGRSRWAIDLPQMSSPKELLPSGLDGASSNQYQLTDGGSSANVAADAKNSNRDGKQAELIHAAAMAIATAPGKQLLMTCFMLWMSGNSLQIFSIMMLGMALWTPITEIFAVHTRFARFADSPVSMLLPKLTFVAMHLAGLSIGLYKCNTMGLLPTSTADWIEHTIRTPVQMSGGGIM